MKKNSIKILKCGMIILIICVIIYTAFTIYKRYHLEESVINEVEPQIIFNEDSSKGLYRLVAKGEIEGIDFNIYTYNGDVQVNFGKEVYSFEEALKTKKISVEKVIEITKKNILDEADLYNVWQDGGTKEYRASNYKIIKFQSLNGLRDFCIGPQIVNLYNIVIDEIE